MPARITAPSSRVQSRLLANQKVANRPRASERRGMVETARRGAGNRRRGEAGLLRRLLGGMAGGVLMLGMGVAFLFRRVFSWVTGHGGGEGTPARQTRQPAPSAHSREPLPPQREEAVRQVQHPHAGSRREPVFDGWDRDPSEAPHGDGDMAWDGTPLAEPWLEGEAPGGWEEEPGPLEEDPFVAEKVSSLEEEERGLEETELVDQAGALRHRLQRRQAPAGDGEDQGGS